MRRGTANWCEGDSQSRRRSLRTDLAPEADPAQHLLPADTLDFMCDATWSESLPSACLPPAEIDSIMFNQLLSECLHLVLCVDRIRQIADDGRLSTGSANHNR